MTPNVDLLEKTYAYIEANPQHWNQGTWRCKTGMCFAGWAASLAGGEWVVETNEGRHNLAGGFYAAEDYLVPEPGDEERDIRTIYLDSKTLRATHVQDRARRLLGLEHDEAEALFSGDNDLDNIRDEIDEIKASVT